MNVSDLLNYTWGQHNFLSKSYYFTNNDCRYLDNRYCGLFYQDNSWKFKVVTEKFILNNMIFGQFLSPAYVTLPAIRGIFIS